MVCVSPLLLKVKGNVCVFLLERSFLVFQEFLAAWCLEPKV